MRVRRMPMHLSSGHVTGAGEILPPSLPNLPPIGLRALGGLTLGFAPNFKFSSAACNCATVVYI